MGIQSLGVGSGLALDDLVSQLLQAERKPKQDRLDSREKTVEAEISAIGSLKSKMSGFKDAVDELRTDYDLSKRSAMVEHPDTGIEPFTAESANSAIPGTYQVAIKELATGSRVDTAAPADGGFTASSDKVLTSGTGSLTFKIDSTGDSFSINVRENMTLEQLRNAINASEDNFGVTANIINTGTGAGGAKLVMNSTVTGTGNDLQIVNDNDLAELNRVSTVSSDGLTSHLNTAISATNAKANIDGIDVESATNKFENTISNVSFEATQISSVDAVGGFLSSTLEVGYDTDVLEKKIRDFIDEYNSLNSEIGRLTRYGESELEDDGALAGDFMVRGIQSGLASILSSKVEGSELGSLFQIGVSFDEDGKLEIRDYSESGLETGEERLETAMEDYFDEISKLFTNEEDGLAVRLYDYLYEFTNYSGLLKSRETAAEMEKDSIADERERLELRMVSYEELLRDRYIALDQTVASLNNTGNALMASLSSLTV